MTKRLAVMASGKGTILKAILEANIPVELLLTDRECNAIAIAQEDGIKHNIMIPRTFDDTFDRTAYTQLVMEILRAHNIELVALAGYMTVFDSLMFEEYENGGFAKRILNTHPSLLPKFEGPNAVQDALDHRVVRTGCTIHYATKELDAGPILAQCAVIVNPNDTDESLHERIKEAEREVYPVIIKQILTS